MYRTSAERHEEIKKMMLAAADKCNIILPREFLSEVALSFDILLRGARDAGYKSALGVDNQGSGGTRDEG